MEHNPRRRRRTWSPNSHAGRGVCEDIGERVDDLVQDGAVADERRAEVHDAVLAIVRACEEACLAQSPWQEVTDQLVALGLAEPDALGVFDQFDRPEEPVTAHVSDDRQLQQFVQAPAQVRRELTDAAQHLIALEDLDVLQGDGSRQRVATESGGVTDRNACLDQRSGDVLGRDDGPIGA